MSLKHVGGHGRQVGTDYHSRQLGWQLVHQAKPNRCSLVHYGAVLSREGVQPIDHTVPDAIWRGIFYDVLSGCEKLHVDGPARQDRTQPRHMVSRQQRRLCSMVNLHGRDENHAEVEVRA